MLLGARLRFSFLVFSRPLVRQNWTFDFWRFLTLSIAAFGVFVKVLGVLWYFYISSLAANVPSWLHRPTAAVLGGVPQHLIHSVSSPFKTPLSCYLWNLLLGAHYRRPRSFVCTGFMSVSTSCSIWPIDRALHSSSPTLCSLCRRELHSC